MLKILTLHLLGLWGPGQLFSLHILKSLQCLKYQPTPLPTPWGPWTLWFGHSSSQLWGIGDADGHTKCITDGKQYVVPTQMYRRLIW